MTRSLVVEAEPAFRTARSNPYNALLAHALVARGARVRDLSWLRMILTRVDIVHLHWPDLTFLSGRRRWRIAARLTIFELAMRISRLRGTRLIWTVHNIASHEQRATPRLRAAHRRMLVRNLDGLLALSESSIAAARRAYPELHDVPAFVTPHGHYRDAYPFGLSREAARDELGVDRDAVFLVSVGQIRPYKNIPALIEAFGRLPDPDVRLVVAGLASAPELEAELRELAALDPRVMLDLGFQSDERLAAWLRVADLVVLPYRAVTNSGSAILGLSADRRVLVPALGSLVELAEAVGDDWLRTFEELDRAALGAAVRWARSAPPVRGVDLSDFDWEYVAERTLSAYRTVRGRARVPARSRTAPPPSRSNADPLSSAPR